MNQAHRSYRANAAYSAPPEQEGPAALDALRNRARMRLLSNALNEHPNAPAHFAAAQGYAQALFEVARGAGRKLAERDAALGGYQPSSAFARAFALFADDIHCLSRAEIAQRVAAAGIDVATEPVSYVDVISTGQAEHGEVSAVNAHDEHAAPRVVVGDGAGGHDGSVANTRGAA